ncbi:penicillin-binding protein [Rhizobium sp. R72]|uniref:transglycosylase domain-containing protein n=1 Tax=unclassified Rhizobium TaxID=2613769 RepID=UPI000B52AFF8|nr:MULTISPECIES: transglycosylase domain-containing protein [unclassified Rhizobium]OWW04987.1 penicillin-binding protein [Rhizobium sp. R72]OWW06044.1 penicillin-binding protein [Rhizobium sp. R711]
MAGRGKSRDRIEPSFSGRDDRDDDDDFSLDADDRVVRGRSTRRAAPKPSRARQPERRKRDRRDREGGGLFGFIRRIVYWCIVFGIWAGIGVAGLVIYYGSRMPSASTWAIPERPPNVKITAVDGSVIANRGTTGGEALALEDMSPYIPEAIVAIEDRRFYSHFGVDPLGLARAFVTNLTTGHMVQGGSTLTQQLAKNLFLSPDRTLERKVQEVLLALWLEQKYTKDQILAMYLNRVFFGSNAYGVEAASRRYFNKSARDVNLGEAALLAGLVKAPSRLSPARDPEAANARAQVVLQTMREQGYITDDEVKTAMSQTPAKAKRYWSGAGHYVADMVMDQLPALIGDVKEDIVVDTTIDKTLEKRAEQSLNDVLGKDGAKLDASQAALVSLDGTGAIRALVGGRDYADSQFNRAVTAKRQPGSSFKPFVYAAALEKGLTPFSVFNDAPIRIGDWTPENYEKKYNGEVTLATALAKSLNTVAAQLVMYDGPDQVIKLAHRLGIESELQPNASIALGTSEVSLMELTGAYAAFMNGGYKATPHVIRRVTTADGSKVLYENTYDNPPRVLSEAIAANMNTMMMGVINQGTGKSAKLSGWQAAGKTGTTQNSRDALFVGFTSNLTTGVWFGNDDGKPMRKVTGGGLPAKAWQEFMVAAHKGLSPAPLFGNGQFMADPAANPGVGDQPMASVEPGAAPPLEEPTTIGSILSGVFGGGADVRERNPQATDRPRRQPMAPANGGPVPPADIAQDGDDGYGDALPPGDIGEPEPSPAGKPRRTTLLDLIMGQ